MPNGRVTKRSADAFACPADKDRVFLWDDTLSGFGLAAFPTGKRFYVAQYRQGGRSQRITLGEHGCLTPEEARAEAKKLPGRVANGSDPIGARQAARAILAFRAVAEAYIEKHVTKPGRSGPRRATKRSDPWSPSPPHYSRYSPEQSGR